MNDDTQTDLLERCYAALAIIVRDLRKRGAHSGFERPDGDDVDVRLKAGDIRRAVAAVNAMEGCGSNLPKPVRGL